MLAEVFTEYSEWFLLKYGLHMQDVYVLRFLW